MVDLEAERLQTLLGELQDQQALTLVVDTLQDYESKRTNDHESRWTNADALIAGNQPIKYWTGTKTPRANHSNRLAYNKIEETYPIIVQSLFGPDGEFFDLIPEEGTSPQDAESMKARINYILAHNRGETGVSAITEIQEAVKSILTYGNGGVCIEWNPLRGVPEISFEDLRNIYFDPGNSSHSVDGCRSVIRRRLLPVSELTLWRSIPGMRVPSDDQLYTLSSYLVQTNGDAVRDQQNALYGEVSSVASSQYAVNPSSRLVEVLYYYSKSQIIIVLGRKYVAYSGDNPYKFFPFAFAHYTTIVGKFYSLGIPDLLTGEQRISEAIVNKHLDELSLAMNPPRARKPSITRVAGTTRWAPGAEYEVGNPKEDVVVLAGKPMTTEIWRDLDYFESLADKRTGKPTASGLRPGNINRTASGVASQVQGGLSRIYMVIKQIEDYLIVPMLCKLQKMLQYHDKPERQSSGISDGKYVPVNTSSYYGRYQFRIKAASDMLSREKLMPLLPVVFQSLGNGPLVQGLTASGMTVNWPEVYRMVKDATGLGQKYEFVRPMNEQERAQLNQPSPEVMMEAQKAQAEQQTRLQLGQMKAQTDLQKEVIKKQPDPQEMEREMMKMQFEQQKAQLQLQIEEQKMQLAAQKAELDLRIKMIESQFKEQQAARDAQFQAAQQEQQFMMQARQNEMDMERSEVEHETELRSNEERERTARESNKIKLDGQRMKLKSTTPTKNDKR